MIRRGLAVGWPAALLAAACLGLAAANWLRPPALVPAFALAVCTAGTVVFGGAGRLALAGVALLAAGLWWGGIRLEALDRSPLSALIDQPAAAVVVVTGPARHSRFAVRVPAQVQRFDGLPVSERVLLELPPQRAPPQGSVLELRARPVAPRGPETGFDERGWLARRGVHVVLSGNPGWRVVGRRGGIGGVGDRLRRHVAQALAAGTSGEQRAVLAGVVLGADERIDEQLRDAFRASGLYHLLAVSGQNVGFVALGLLFLAYVAGLPRWLGHLAALAGIGAYVLAVGWQPSVVRAGVAAAIASLAWLAARPADRWHALVLGALVLLAWTPASLLEPGFQLSFVAVTAIFLAVPRLQRFQAGFPVPRLLVELVGVAAACGVATAPVLLLQFGSVPVWTVPANALAEPAMPPLLVLGLAAALVAPVLPSAAVALSWLAGWCAWWIAASARLVASFPHPQASSPYLLAAIGAVLVAAVGLSRLPPYRRRAAVLAVATLLPLALACRWALTVSPVWRPPPGLRATILDVGQGDAILLEVAQGAVLVDAGPPEAHVERLLRRRGLRSLSALVLTHPHRDHVGGAAAVLRRLEVGSLLDPGQPGTWPEDMRAQRAARDSGTRFVAARAGAVYRLGGLRLQVLWPDGGGLPGEDPHRHGVVVLASYGRVDLLLTGDAESDVTGRLPLRAVEVLKVAHHGSADPGLERELLVLRPRVAVISVGSGNDYGHPRAETLSALRAVPGLVVYRTDENGAVVLESDGQGLTVHTDREVP